MQFLIMEHALLTFEKACNTAPNKSFPAGVLLYLMALPHGQSPPGNSKSCKYHVSQRVCIKREGRGLCEHSAKDYTRVNSCDLQLTKSTKMEWRSACIQYGSRALLLWALWELRVTREGIVTMTLPKEAESQEEILQAFKQRASSCSEDDSCEAQVCGVSLCKTRWPSLKKPTLIPFCQLQELLAKMEEISDDIYRLKGGWTAATDFRVWNQSPATARDPRPLAIESFR